MKKEDKIQKLRSDLQNLEEELKGALVDDNKDELEGIHSEINSKLKEIESLQNEST